MTRELAILGFVSFTATVILQFVHLEEEKHELFEYAHVLMFTIAVVYAKEIAIVSIKLGRISRDFEAHDAASDEEVLRLERDWWVSALRTPGLRGLLLRRWRSSSFNPALNHMMN